MTYISNISAVLFDMDGTLVDSELLTEPVIREFCKESGLGDVDYQWTEFHGVTWQQVARRIAGDHMPGANIAETARQLHSIWDRSCKESPPMPVPGAKEAVIAAHACMSTAIVSSAYRDSIDLTVRQLGLESYVTGRFGAEDYAKSKPAPDGFLHAADVLQVPPQQCLVFEDSLAGLRSAREAGMAVVAITHRSNVAAGAAGLADYAIGNFTDLEDGFFATISCATQSSGRSG